MAKRGAASSAVVALPGAWVTEALVPTIGALKSILSTDIVKNASWANFLVVRPEEGIATVTTPVAGARLTFPPMEGRSFAIPYASVLAMRREDWTQPLPVHVPASEATGRIVIDVSARTAVSFPMRAVASIPGGIEAVPTKGPEDLRGTDLTEVAKRLRMLAAWIGFVYETDVAKRNVEYRPLLSCVLAADNKIVATDSKIAVVATLATPLPHGLVAWVPFGFVKLLAGLPVPRDAGTDGNKVWTTVDFTDEYTALVWATLPAISDPVAGARGTISALAGLTDTVAQPGDVLLPTEVFIDAVTEVAAYAAAEIVAAFHGTSVRVVAGEDTDAQAVAAFTLSHKTEWHTSFGYDVKLLQKILKRACASIRVCEAVGTLCARVERDAEEIERIDYVLAAAVETGR